MTDRELLQSIQQQISDQLAPPPPAVPPPVSGTLRLLTWNAHHGGQLSDGSKTDMVGFSNWVIKFAPDVACHQEMDVLSSPQLLDKMLRQQAAPDWHFGWSGTRGNSWHAHGVNTPLTGIQTASDEGRSVMLYGTVTINGRSVSVLCAHLNAYYDTKRLAEVKAVLAELDRIEKPYPDIWAGDFNMHVGDSEYNAILAAGYDDAWVVAHARENYPGNCDGCTKGSRIDYVFVRKASNLTVTTAAIPDTRNAAGVMPSDHKPLVVDLSWVVQ